MLKGVAKFLNERGGFRFITPDSPVADVYVQISVVRNCGVDGLSVGQSVILSH
jgi:cold shock CspA family protein